MGALHDRLDVAWVFGGGGGGGGSSGCGCEDGGDGDGDGFQKMHIEKSKALWQERMSCSRVCYSDISVVFAVWSASRGSLGGSYIPFLDTPLNDDFESAMVIDLICFIPEELLDMK